MRAVSLGTDPPKRGSAAPGLEGNVHTTLHRTAGTREPPCSSLVTAHSPSWLCSCPHTASCGVTAAPRRNPALPQSFPTCPVQQRSSHTSSSCSPVDFGHVVEPRGLQQSIFCKKTQRKESGARHGCGTTQKGCRARPQPAQVARIRF